ncbi:MAG: hypothetical protein M1156_01655 [Candidatus Marsarchaeota archaeon]|jgi:hypothetical protein|nr:hypothetical protein [Candidatus Marsarchaeota archaeon]
MKHEKQKSYCIVCGQERDGIEIKEDNVIRSIRFIKKKVFNSVKNNRIVVCKECYEKYKKYRKRYVRRQAMYVALGVIFLIMLLLISSSSSPTIYSFLYALSFGIGVLILLYLLSLLNYMPELKINPKPSKASMVYNKK